MKQIAAGGLVFMMRGETCGVLMITDRYGKITLPKGKQEVGETIEQTALREVLEETGIQGEIKEPLSVMKYSYPDDNQGQVEKEVHYFLIKANADQPDPKPQIEEICSVSWHTPQDALRLQQQAGYENNTSLLEQGLDRLSKMKHAEDQSDEG